MGIAVAVHDPADRPGWLEKILVLGICAALLLALHVADQRGRQRNAERAGEVVAERAERTVKPANSRPSPAIALPSGAGWGAILHRTQGPRTPDPTSAIPEPAAGSPVTRAARPVAAAAPAAPRADAGPILLLVMGAAGLSMCGAGLRLLSRRSA